MSVILIYNSQSNFCKKLILESPIHDLILFPINKKEIYNRIKQSAYNIKEIPTVLVFNETRVNKYEGLFAYKYLLDVKERSSNKKYTYEGRSPQSRDDLEERFANNDIPTRRGVMSKSSAPPPQINEQPDLRVESKDATTLKERKIIRYIFPNDEKQGSGYAPRKFNERFCSNCNGKSGFIIRR